MSSSRHDALRAISVGDLIYGVGEGGQQKILLVYQADEERIFARHITTQTRIEFGRDGKSRRTWDGGLCKIISTAVVSSEDYEVAIGLDHKMRTAKELTDLRLSKAEISLLLTVHDFFNAHPLPES